MCSKSIYSYLYMSLCRAEPGDEWSSLSQQQLSACCFSSRCRTLWYFPIQINILTVPVVLVAWFRKSHCWVFIGTTSIHMWKTVFCWRCLGPLTLPSVLWIWGVGVVLYQYLFYVFLDTYLSTILGNLLLIILILLDSHLCTSMNFLLINLPFSDLCDLSSVTMPQLLQIHDPHISYVGFLI